MTPDQLTNAISAAFSTGFRDFLVGTMVAALPMLWAAALVFYLMRPYAIRTLRKLSLRFGADVFWLSYVLLRDGVLVITVVISLLFFYPNLLHNNPIPVTASLSAVCALWVLLLKMVRDPDENPMDYRITALLLSLGSALYLIPLTMGVEVNSQQHLSGLSKFLTSNTDFSLAIALFYVAITLVVATGLFVFGYVLKVSAPKPELPTRPLEGLANRPAGGK